MMKKNTCVPGFVSKLWTLVDNPGTNDVICWSLDGTNFRILDEQRFTKEILPKYFKHSNLSSFVRQLNMYGFRKVISIEGGLVKPKNLSVLEFHHMHFQKGKEHLLDCIKRKVSSVRTEDTKISQEDMCKVLGDVQQVRGKQDDMDQKLDNMKRENEILWKEVASLRKKHSLQQKTLSKVIRFFASLMQGNCVIGIKNKRPLMIDMSEAPPAKVNRPCVLSLNDSSLAMSGGSSGFNCPSSSGLTIVDITDNAKQDTSWTHPSATAKAHPVSPVLTMEGGQAEVMCKEPAPKVEVTGISNLEDEILDSILQEEATAMAPYQMEVTINRDDIQDHIDDIDSTFEDLQMSLLGKQFSVKPDFIDNLFNPGLSDVEIDMPENTVNMGMVSEWPNEAIQVRDPAITSEAGKGSEVTQRTPTHLHSLLDELCNTLDLGSLCSPCLSPRPAEESSTDSFTHSGLPGTEEEAIQQTDEATGAADLISVLPEELLQGLRSSLSQ